MDRASFHCKRKKAVVQKSMPILSHDFLISFKWYDHPNTEFRGRKNTMQKIPKEQTRAPTSEESWSCGCDTVTASEWDRASWISHDMLWTILTWTTGCCVTCTVILLSVTFHPPTLRRPQNAAGAHQLAAIAAHGSLWCPVPLRVHYQTPSLGRCQWSQLYHEPS